MKVTADKLESIGDLNKPIQDISNLVRKTIKVDFGFTSLAFFLINFLIIIYLFILIVIVSASASPSILWMPKENASNSTTFPVVVNRLALFFVWIFW